jgi:hypothetical protein
MTRPPTTDSLCRTAAIGPTSSALRNQPARRLYQSLGFRVVDEREVAPGILVTRYELERAGG